MQRGRLVVWCLFMTLIDLLKSRSKLWPSWSKRAGESWRSCFHGEVIKHWNTGNAAWVTRWQDMEEKRKKKKNHHLKDTWECNVALSSQRLLVWRFGIVENLNLSGIFQESQCLLYLIFQTGRYGKCLIQNMEAGTLVETAWMLNFHRVVGTLLMIKKFKYHYNISYPVESVCWRDWKCQSMALQQTEVGL